MNPFRSIVLWYTRSMKKYPSGFVPINYQRAGKLMVVIGLVCLLAILLGILTGAYSLPYSVLFFGLAFLILGPYLIFVVPKIE